MLSPQLTISSPRTVGDGIYEVVAVIPDIDQAVVDQLIPLLEENEKVTHIGFEPKGTGYRLKAVIRDNFSSGASRVMNALLGPATFRDIQTT